jgi:type I restriction enzyme, S subunit
MTQSVHDLLEQHFDAAFAAPDGIAKLRELILTLAMQGKLVEQDPNDPPASELLKEIEVEKQRLIAEKKIKKQKPLPPIKPEEVPYQLPQGWEWVRLSDACDVRDGTHDTPKYVEVGYPLVTSKNIYTGELSLENVKYISQKDHEKIVERSKVDKGDILFAMIGSIGNPVIVDSDVEFSIKNVALFKFFMEGKPNNSYLHYYLMYAQERMKALSSGAVQNFVSLGFLRNYLLPLPPLPEQSRIVDRIDQLMKRCDELEKLRKDREEKRLQVHAAAINQLLNAPENSGWPFIQQHFGELYTVKENVAELRKAILQLAVMGRLVPQDPNDPPARELLKEIEAEKQRLIADKKIRNQKPLPPIKPEEIKHELPSGWEWVRLGDIGNWKSGSTPSRSTPSYYGGDIPWVKSGEVKQGRIRETEETITQVALEKCSLGLNPVGSVLVAMYGANIGEVGILEIEATTNQAVCACQTYAHFDENYLLYLITSMKPYFLSQGAGAAQPNISREKIIATVFPLPPLSEQHRIVARIDQLMALCDKLDSQIDAATNKQDALLNAVMARV